MERDRHSREQVAAAGAKAGGAEGYRSPPRKLVKFFKQSRDQWKTKCLEAKARSKGLKKRLQFVEKSKASWKSRVHALKGEIARLQAEQQALKAAQVRRRLSDSCPDEKLLYLMIVDPSQSQAVRERETAEITVAMEA